jgi:hypothetical protein
MSVASSFNSAARRSCFAFHAEYVQQPKASSGGRIAIRISSVRSE